MDLFLQVHYSVIEEESGRCCAKVFRYERLFYHRLIIKVKVVESLPYDIVEGFYARGFSVTEGLDALTNLYARGFSTLCA